MPGITAFVRLQPTSVSPSHLLARTLQASFPLPECITEQAHLNSSEIAFGGTFPRHFQRPAVVATKNGNTVLFYGELYNDLGGKSEAEYVAGQLQHKGDLSFLTELNGPFALFLWDEHKHELVVATDRLGRFPVFHGTYNGCFVATTDLHSPFNAGVLTPELRDEAVADFLTIGFPLGDQSLYNNIDRLTGGSVLRISREGISRSVYWDHRVGNELFEVEPLLDAFRFCVDRSLRGKEERAVTLSGGWDTRVTAAVAASLGLPFVGVTFGVQQSADVELAAAVARTLHVPHIIIQPKEDFFASFHTLAEKVVALSAGHLSVALAFQIYAYERLRTQFVSLVDSAGCEFHRGIRALRAVRNATSTADITRFLRSMYGTGVWNPEIIDKDFYAVHRTRTDEKLTGWLDSRACRSFSEQVDAFSIHELWGHSYAHGYPLQTSFIGCQMPFSDNEFYELYLRASESIRWSHRFHRAAIHHAARSLEQIPICHGPFSVPYGESLGRYVPVLYYRWLSTAASVPGLSWLHAFSNYRPFRPYHRWYAQELAGHARDMLNSSAMRLSGYVNVDAATNLLEKQMHDPRDYSHGINLLLTLAHLLEYVKSFRPNTTLA